MKSIGRKLGAIAAIAVAAVLGIPAQAQITIEECMELARQNYPQIRQLDLIEEAARYDMAGVSKSWLPRLNISGKAAYQSDVVEMPFDIPGFSFDLPHESGTEVRRRARKTSMPQTPKSRRNRWKYRCIP